MKLLLTLLVSVSAQTPTAEIPPTPSQAVAAEDHEINKQEAVEDDDENALLKRLAPDQLMQVLLEREKTTQQRNSGPQVDIVAPTGFFLLILAVVALTVSASLKKTRQRHETIRLLLEKGMPISPELLDVPRKPASNLGQGLSLIAVGVGLMIMLAAIDSSPGLWTTGLIPLLLGAAKLLMWKIETRAARST